MRSAAAKSAAERARNASADIVSSMTRPVSATQASHTAGSSGSPQKRRSGPMSVTRGQMQA